MHYIADLEIHTKYARAVSKDSDLEHHALWAKRKGIDIVGTGDFTHPAWYKELQSKLMQTEPGLYMLKGDTSQVRFLCTSEVSCIWGQGGKTRRVHILLHAPDLETVGKINYELGRVGKLASDGRPILGLSAERLCEIVFGISSECLVIPAHVWTPWFGMYGSKSGFDSLEECFGSFADLIPAIETGLSSDPPMNWRMSALDEKAIVSYSDAHSPPNLGREATVFDLSEVSFDALARAVRRDSGTGDQIVYTIEFFPEEGMYHYDGHRDCGVRFEPRETKKYNNLCPKCKKPLTVGVLNRVEALADRPEGYQDSTRPRFRSLVPLPEIIADAMGVGKQTKKVEAAYQQLLDAGKSDFNILLTVPEEELDAICDAAVSEGIKRVRRRKLHIEPGYDGVYGVVKVFTDEEREKFVGGGQKSLF